jgi:hypothetical protein
MSKPKSKTKAVQNLLKSSRAMPETDGPCIVFDSGQDLSPSPLIQAFVKIVIEAPPPSTRYWNPLIERLSQRVQLKDFVFEPAGNSNSTDSIGGN